MCFEKINVNDIPSDEYAAIYNRLPSEQRKKIKALKPDDIKRTLAGRLLLFNMADSCYGKNDVTVHYGENGKPLTDFCFFSISHSGDYAVCAVSDKPIGADIQKTGGFKRRERYILFTENESRYVNESENPTDAFYTLWTMKEAYVKANGFKLNAAAEISFVGDDLTVYNRYEKFSFKTDRFGDYYICICKEH